MMNEELKVVKQAIIGEIEGYEFYRMAAEQASLVEVKEAFLKLANEELKHVEWLKNMFNSMKAKPEDAFKLSELEEVPAPNLFHWSRLDRDGAQKALSVFGIGIQMERQATEFYSKAAEKTTVKEAQKLFQALASWEKMHLEQFSAEYEKLMEDWWSEQEFAPF